MKMPEGAWRGEGAAGGWSNIDNFILRESGVAKGILAVALLGHVAVVNGEGDEEVNQRLSHNRHEAIAFGPGVMVMIIQDGNMAFGADWSAILVPFNDTNTHAGYGQPMLFGEAVIFQLFDWIEDVVQSRRPWYSSA